MRAGPPPVGILSGRRLDVLVLAAIPLVILATSLPVMTTTFDAETTFRFLRTFHMKGDTGLLETAAEGLRQGTLRPLLSLSFLMDYRLFGTDPVPYHVTDLLLTWLCGAMAYALFSRRLGRGTAALAVLIWAALPVQPSSLATFLGRNDRLMLPFILGSLLVYDRAIEAKGGSRRRTKLLVATLLFLSAGLLAKESVLYYGIFLYLWSTIVAGRGELETLRRDALLWAGLLLVGGAYVAGRAAFGTLSAGAVSPMLGDSYLKGLGVLLSWVTPLQPGEGPATLLGVVTLLLIPVVMLLRRLPSPVRYGVACLVLGFVHLPLFWLQHCFLWLPWLWGALALSGALLAIGGWLRRRSPRLGTVAAVALGLALFVTIGRWSRRRAHSDAEPLRMVDDAAQVLTRLGPLPERGVLHVEGLQEAMPELWALMPERGGDPTGQEAKVLLHVLNLTRMRTGMDTLRLEWASGENRGSPQRLEEALEEMARENSPLL